MAKKEYYKENGSYCTKIYLGRDSNGKPKYKKLKAKTTTELRKKERLFREELESGLDVLNCDDTLEKWAERYINRQIDKVENDCLKESEFNTAKSRLEYFTTYKGGTFAKTRLKDIMPDDIQPIIYALYKNNPSTGKKTAKRTLIRYLNELKHVFEYARKQRCYNYPNPCDDVTIPEKAIEEKRDALNHHEIIAVINTEHRAKLAAHIMMFAGLRRGELTALTWDDIDLEKRIICVNKSYNFKSNEVKETKSDAGVRKIPINDSLFKLLQEEKMKTKRKLVIEKVTKGIMTESAWKRMFESYEKAIRKQHEQTETFEMFTPHMLRHTYCSMLSWAGVDIKSAQVLMGHSDFSTTANIYTHANEEIKTNAAIMQEDFIKNILNQRNI